MALNDWNKRPSCPLARHGWNPHAVLMLQAGKGLVRAMRLREKLAAFRRSEGGNILMTFALSITVLAGAAGLGTEVASWYSTRRTMQNAADLGAAGGALFLKTYFANASSTYDG